MLRGRLLYSVRAWSWSCRSPLAWSESGSRVAYRWVVGIPVRPRDASCEQEVVRVDGGKLDADEDLVGAGSVGLGNIDILKTVDRVAKSCELNSTHIDISF